MTTLLNTKLRQQLLDGYESEREEWGDEYTDGCIAKLQGIPDGEYPEPADLGDVFTDENVATDLALSAEGFLAVGIEYFGLDA